MSIITSNKNPESQRMANSLLLTAWEPEGPKHRTYMQLPDSVCNLYLIQGYIPAWNIFFIKNKMFLSYLVHSPHCLPVISSGYSVGLQSSYNFSSGCCCVRLTSGSQKVMFLFILRIKPPIHSLRRSEKPHCIKERKLFICLPQVLFSKYLYIYVYWPYSTI